MKYPLLFLFLISLFGCKDKPEQIPAYLSLKPFEVDAQGDASWHKITDGWLYVNGEYLGAYTLPALVPILAEGQSEVILFPGVKENGILATPNIYPLLTRWESNAVQLVAGQTTDIQPNTTYDLGTNYSFGIGRGDFDGGSSIVFEDRDDDEFTSFSLVTNGAFAGKSILMQMDTAHPLIEIATEQVSGLPTSGAPEVWLEMHYQCDMTFFLFLLYSDGAGPEASQAVIGINPSESWNKIYINLTNVLSLTQANTYRLFLRAPLPKDNTGNFSQLSGTVRVDNIRLLHL